MMYVLHGNVMAWHAGSLRVAVLGEMPPGTFHPIPLAARGATSLEIRRGILWGQELQGRGQGQDGQCTGLDVNLEVCGV